MLSSRYKLPLLALTLTASAASVQLQAQEIYVSDNVGNAVSTYDLSGNPISNPLIDNLSNPDGLAVSGDTLYVSNYGVSTIATYNASTGAPLGSNPFISTGLSYPTDIVVSGNDLYVANKGTGNIDLFDATSGAMIGSNPLISSLTDPEYLALSGNDLYVSTKNAIFAFNATNGAPIGSGTLVLGLQNATGITVNGNTLYVADATAGTVTAFSATTGAQIGANPLITGLEDPSKIEFYNGDLYIADTASTDQSIMTYDATTGQLVVNCWYAPNAVNFTIADPGTQTVPEPSTWALLVAGVVAMAYLRRRRALVHASQLSF